MASINMKLRTFLFLLAILLACFQIGQCQKKIREAEARILKQLLQNYDPNMRPAGVNETETENKPVTITVNMLVRSINSIDDVTMQMSSMITFRQQWNDDRLQFDNMSGKIPYLSLSNSYKIWTPDTFFKNEQGGHFHEIMKPNVLLRIYPNGDIYYSIRLSVVSQCPMDLKYYPSDVQTCTIALASYGYTEDDIKYIWKEKNPVQVSYALNLPRFTLTQYNTADCSSKTNTGTYSCLKAEFTLQREFNYYLIQMYIPCIMLILLSWTGFWLDVKKYLTARVLIQLGSLLTMATQIAYFNAAMPPVSYTKSIDIWTGISLTFIFVSLLETVSVAYIAKHANDGEDSRQYKLLNGMRSMGLDRLSRVLFPVTFLFFVIVYCLVF